MYELQGGEGKEEELRCGIYVCTCVWLFIRQIVNIRMSEKELELETEYVFPRGLK